MLKLSKTALTILTILSDQISHSSNEFVDILRISRTAVWKQINSLKKIGYKIDSSQSKGYKLNMLGGVLLKSKIDYYLNILTLYGSNNNDLSVDVLAQLDSTNEFLKKFELSDCSSQICLTEQQTNGRGRFKRIWHSPFGENIYLSIKQKLNISLAQMSGFSLCISLAIVDGLIEAGFSSDYFSIKWPNDILHNGHKLAGILIELTGQIGDLAEAIIGIGLNVNMRQADIDRQWTSLAIVNGAIIDDRNFIAAHIIIAVLNAIEKFEEHGFSYFKNAWNKRDVMLGKKVDLNFQGNILSGTCHGIDNNGNILIKHENKYLKSYSAGEVSFHKQS